jgi:WD40 repeat protein
MQYLLSSSMDKTVKLWDITTSTCLKTFSHTDYGKSSYRVIFYVWTPFFSNHVYVWSSLTINYSAALKFVSVTCIQFNPVDDNFFISGSLDEKVRIWNVHDRKIEDWNDLHEMVTAACYSPDGQVDLVSSEWLSIGHKTQCAYSIFLCAFEGCTGGITQGKLSFIWYNWYVSQCSYSPI